MGIDEISERLGALAAELASTNKLVALHMESDAKWHEASEAAIADIRDTLTQAKGIRRFLVWCIATGFAAVALAKGWLLR